MGNLKDFATALIVTAPSPATTGTSLVIEAGYATRFPAVPFFATAHPQGTLPTLDNAEKVKVTAIAGDTFTIVRAQGDTTAKTIADGWRISNVVFKSDLDEKANDSAVVHIAGAETITSPKTFNAGTLLDKGSEVYNVKAYGAVGDGVTNDAAAIQAAIDACNTAGGGVVYLPEAVYIVTTAITPKNNVLVVGAGKGVTILKTGVASGYFFTSTTTLSRFGLQDMTIDCGNTVAGSGVSLYYASNCLINRVEFKNGATNGWLLKFGVTTGATDGVLCLNNKIIDCDFNTHAGTLEMLLLFNCRNTEVIRPYFTGKTGGSVIFGLWQKTYNTRIVEPTFRDNAGICLYYSITCEETVIENLYAENNGIVIQGANISDNGAFGLTQAKGLHIINPVIIGGANSTTAYGIQLGAVNNVSVINAVIEEYETGILFDNGNNAANTAATNWTILNPHIRNCNPVNNVHVYHTGIFFQAIGGSMYGRIIGGSFYDDQATKTQRYPIGFSGAFTWDYLTIINNRLSADTASGGTSITLQDTAALGSNVLIQDNQDYSGSTPAQTVIPVSRGGTGSATQNFVDLTTAQTIGGLKTFSGPIATPIATKTANYTITSTDSVILANATTAPFTVTLSTAVGCAGRQYTIKKTDVSANAVTVDGNAGEAIDGNLTHALNAQYQSITIVSNGANWFII